MAVVQERAKILECEVQTVSPWVSLAAKRVDFALGGPPQTYHCLQQSDYIGILARTPAGLIPIVRQFRPAVESYTWELPAGLIEKDETPEECCRRELLEEAGVQALRIVSLGSYWPDTGRLGNCMHGFFAEVSEPVGTAVEAGMTVRFVTSAALAEMILSGDFRHQLHLGVLAAAQVYKVWSF